MGYKPLEFTWDIYSPYCIFDPAVTIGTKYKTPALDLAWNTYNSVNGTCHFIWPATMLIDRGEVWQVTYIQV